MEGNTRSVARPDGGSRKEFTNWDAVAHPVPDINLDGRPMEGNTYLEPSTLGVSLDSGLMEGMSRLEPLEQSVLGALSVVRPDETDTPERRTLASQMNHEWSRFKSSARPMLDLDKVDGTDVNADVNTDLPENSAPMMNLDLRFWQSDAQLCPLVVDTLERRSMEGISGRLLVNSPGLALAPDSGYVKDPPHPSPFEQGALGVNRRYDYWNSCDEPQSGLDSGQSSLEWEDVIRHAVLKGRSTGRVPGHDDNGLMLSPVDACCGDKELSMDEVRSEGLWQWNMDMDVECQYETFNGLPVCYGGDLCDSKELEEYDTLDLARAAYAEDDNFDATERMDLMICTRSRPDGGETRGVDTVDMVYVCQTVVQDEPDRASETAA